MSEHNSSTSPARSHVCTACRAKRMRCSGDLPTCLQCTRARKIQPCVYEPPPKNRIQALSKKVRELEDQISLLESLDTAPTPPSPTLISPTSLHRDSLMIGKPEEEREVFQPPPEGIEGVFSRTFKRHVITTLRRYPDGAESAHLIPQMYEALELPPTHEDALHPCLVYALYLFACHHSQATHGQYQSVLVSLIRRECLESLAMADRLLHFIMASVFLAHWYVCNGRMVEAHHQASAVSQFAISCKLDQINSPWLIDAPRSILGPPKDVAELGYRVTVFWTVFSVDKVVSLSSGFPATFIDHKISTMWPLPQEYFVDGRVTLEKYASISTMFTEGDTSLDVGLDDLQRLNVKSLALLDQAARLASRTRASRANPSPGQSGSSSSSNRASSLRREARALNAGLPEFIRTLQPQRIHAQMDGYGSALLATVLTTVRGASMELHSIDAIFDPGSYDAMLEDAMTIAELARETEAVDPIPLGPVVGLTWIAACDVLIRDVQGRTDIVPVAGLPTPTRARIAWLLNSIYKTASVYKLYEGPFARLRGLVAALERRT